MKKYLWLPTFSLILALVFGAAFRSGNARNILSGDLKLGEYACYGSGGTLLVGLGFRVQTGHRYTDLDDKSHGTFSVDGDKVTFHGGHLDGEVGQDLRDHKFRINSISCEPFK